MDTHVKVMKEALAQIRKANSWVEPALEVEEIDDELAQDWADVAGRIENALKDFLEDAR